MYRCFLLNSFLLILFFKDNKVVYLLVIVVFYCGFRIGFFNYKGLYINNLFLRYKDLSVFFNLFILN